MHRTKNCSLLVACSATISHFLVGWSIHSSVRLSQSSLKGFLLWFLSLLIVEKKLGRVNNVCLSVVLTCKCRRTRLRSNDLVFCLRASVRRSIAWYICWSGVSICKRFFDLLITLTQYGDMNSKTFTVFLFPHFNHLPFLFREKQFQTLCKLG